MKFGSSNFIKQLMTKFDKIYILVSNIIFESDSIMLIEMYFIVDYVVVMVHYYRVQWWKSLLASNCIYMHLYFYFVEIQCLYLLI